MTQQSSSTQRKRSLRILALHGLPMPSPDAPDLYEEPEMQLEPIRQRLGLAGDDDRWRNWRWAFGEEKDNRARRKLIVEILLQMRRKTFRSKRTSDFNGWFLEQTDGLTEEEHILVVIAYSAGASIVFSWLAENATNSDHIGSVEKIVCIAGLYQFQSPGFEPGWIILPRIKNPIQVNEPSIEIQGICRRVKSEQLIALLGELDNTSHPDYNGFKVDGVDVAECTEAKVECYVIEGVDHITILTDGQPDGAPAKITRIIGGLN